MTNLNLTADELLSTTRAVRHRLDLTRPVEPEVINECLALATQAPTGRNRQRWEFVLVTDPEKRRQVAEYWRKGLMRPTQPVRFDNVNRGGRPSSKMYSGADYLFHRLHEAPVLLIPCVHAVRSGSPSTTEQANNWGSILPAVWSFMLAARERGLGTVWTTGNLHYEREIAEVLSIPYDRVMQTMLTPVAYTIGTGFKPGRRTDLANVVHWNSWEIRTPRG